MGVDKDDVKRSFVVPTVVVVLELHFVRVYVLTSQNLIIVILIKMISYILI